MKSAIVAAAILGLTASGSLAAEMSVAPLELTDAQMDGVTAGLVTVVAVDVVDIETGDILRTVFVPVNAQIAVLGNAVGGQGIRFVPRPPG